MIVEVHGVLIMLSFRNVIIFGANNGSSSHSDNRKNNFLILGESLGSISIGFSAIESREVSLNGNVYDFSVDYNSIDKSDILNIRKYFMTKNNI